MGITDEKPKTQSRQNKACRIFLSSIISATFGVLKITFFGYYS